MRALLKPFVADTRGSVAITAAVTFPVLFGLAAAQMTYSAAVQSRADMQAAIDAATLAAAAMPNGTSERDRIQRAHLVFNGNVNEARRFARPDRAFFSVRNRVTPTFTVTNEEQVVGNVSIDMDFPLSSFITSGPLELSVKSVAEKGWSAPICLLALNGSAQGGFDLNGNAQVSAPECAGMTNSDNRSAMRTVGTAHANASEFGVTGRARGDGFKPQPVDGVDPFEDPFADVPFPPIGPCVDVSGKLQQVHVVLSPGTYCDDLEIKAQSTVRFQPGIYIMNNSMLKIDSDAVVTGEEVMFAFTGRQTKLWFSSGATITLTAPKTGLYAGFQFFQAADDLSTQGGWATIIGGVNLDYDGIFYFPNQHIWIAGGSTVKAKTSSYAMVADKLWFQDSSRTEIALVDDPSNPNPGRFRTGARLVE